MARFNVGDRVEAKKNIDGMFTKGLKGTVIYIYGDSLGIEFDQELGGLSHSCDGKGKNSHCWYCYRSELKPIIQDWDE